MEVKRNTIVRVTRSTKQRETGNRFYSLSVPKTVSYTGSQTW